MHTITSAYSSSNAFRHSSTLFGVGFVPSSARRSFNAAVPVRMLLLPTVPRFPSWAGCLKLSCSLLFSFQPIVQLCHARGAKSNRFHITLFVPVKRDITVVNHNLLYCVSAAFPLLARLGCSDCHGIVVPYKRIATSITFHCHAWLSSNLFSSSSTSYRQWTRSLFAFTSIPSCSAHCQGILFRLSL